MVLEELPSDLSSSGAMTFWHFGFLKNWALGPRRRTHWHLQSTNNGTLTHGLPKKNVSHLSPGPMMTHWHFRSYNYATLTLGLLEQWHLDMCGLRTVIHWQLWITEVWCNIPLISRRITYIHMILIQWHFDTWGYGAISAWVLEQRHSGTWS